MPANVVRTLREERLWRQAKQQVAKRYGGQRRLGRGRYWALVNGIFQRMKYRTGGSNVAKRKRTKHNPVKKNFLGLPTWAWLVAGGLGFYLLFKSKPGSAAPQIIAGLEAENQAMIAAYAAYLGVSPNAITLSVQSDGKRVLSHGTEKLIVKDLADLNANIAIFKAQRGMKGWGGMNEYGEYLR